MLIFSFLFLYLPRLSYLFYMIWSVSSSSSSFISMIFSIYNTCNQYIVKRCQMHIYLPHHRKQLYMSTIEITKIIEEEKNSPVCLHKISLIFFHIVERDQNLEWSINQSNYCCYFFVIIIMMIIMIKKRTNKDI